MLIFSLICFIMSNAVATNKNAAILYSRSAILPYIFSVCIIYNLYDMYFYKTYVALFNGLIHINLSLLVFILFLTILTFNIITLTSFYPFEITKVISNNNNKIEKNNLKFSKETVWEYINSVSMLLIENQQNIIKQLLQADKEQYKLLEYALIIQFILIGSITLLSGGDLITLFLSIELQSYGLYIISTIYKNSESSTSAGLTYFLLGGLSSCIILLGQSFIYINTGSTSLDGLYTIYNIITSDAHLSFFYLTSNNTMSDFIYIFNSDIYQYALQFSLIILCIGFLFKISAAPFHSWSPGVYDAIPTVTTTFVAIIPKISILILFLDLVYSTWQSTLSFSWTSIFLFSSFLSLIIGSVLGLTQFRIKRLYAYSTISHVGFILLALSVHSVESIQAFYFYIIQYSLSNLNAFFILIVIGYTYANYSKVTNNFNSLTSLYKDYKIKLNNLSPIEYIDVLKGYAYLNPLLAISLSITLYSFIGVPPMVGFFAKQMILSSALDNGDIFMCLIAILTSVVSAVYYLYIVKIMFFDKITYDTSKYTNKVYNVNRLETESEYSSDYFNNKKQINLSGVSTILISILTLLILLFIFLYNEIYLLMNIISILLTY